MLIATLLCLKLTTILILLQILLLGQTKQTIKKKRALISAARWIDTLVFYGDRCDESQALKFPRTNYQVDGVELACTTIPK